MKVHKLFFSIIALSSLYHCSFNDSAIAQDITNLGGDLTSQFPDRAAIQVKAPNVTDEARQTLQLSGFAVFHSLFKADTGLGPNFVNTSCGGCHVNNGRGPIKFRNGFPGSTMVVKTSFKGLNEDGSPKDVTGIAGIGEQLQNHAVGMRNGIKVELEYKIIKGQYFDGTKYELKKPILSFTVRGRKKRNIITSLRMTPPVIGPGLLEAIPDSTIITLSDPLDADKDGISGRINYVNDLKSGTKKIGRFGFKASHPTLEQQSAAAAFHDIGITNKLFRGTQFLKEMTDDDLEKLIIYQKLAGVPMARNQSNPKVLRGKEYFKQIGCNECHIMEMRTEDYADPELANQVFHPFTDLLLHDMGKGLADKRAEFSASGSEWRTTPLWGLGFSKVLADSKQKLVYLHDGRASTIEEAILWHGGEAARSQIKFRSLPKQARSDLLEFLKSL